MVRICQGAYCNLETNWNGGPNLLGYTKQSFTMNVSAVTDVIVKQMMCSTAASQVLTQTVSGMAGLQPVHGVVIDGLRRAISPGCLLSWWMHRPSFWMCFPPGRQLAFAGQFGPAGLPLLLLSDPLRQVLWLAAGWARVGFRRLTSHFLNWSLTNDSGKCVTHLRRPPFTFSVGCWNNPSLLVHIAGRSSRRSQMTDCVARYCFHTRQTHICTIERSC